MKGREFRYNYKDYKDVIIDTKYRKKRKGFEQNLRGCRLLFESRCTKAFHVSAYNSLFSRSVSEKYHKYILRNRDIKMIG